MKRVGVIGLGDMGSGLAKNLMQKGFETYGLDLSEARMQAFVELGGKPTSSVAELGQNSDAVFVMVMNGKQAKQVISGSGGLKSSLKPGAAIILTATINAYEAREIGAELAGTGVHIIDSPVSGGFPGAQGGTLTMMAAGTDEALREYEDVMKAVSRTIHRVGDEAGMGQTVKAVLQSLIGSIFSATFEAAALAAKAGVRGQVLYDVVSTSGAGCGVANNALAQIIDRKFVGTGSAIGTMYKDLTISLDMARELGVPLFTASTAMQLFQAGKTKHPEGDNWIVTRVIEDIIGAELSR
ncbi:MAG: NAD(P)-dependent oxidoreductase [Devosia marina]|uniref:NAD(P)-dependent oxidoreductase n=1 Tax=Devosia marina TaxID=2683198 RepID=UPI000D5DA317